MTQHETDWIAWTGGPRPDAALVKVRLRCRTREDANRQAARPPKEWPRWTHDGGPGDIVEIKEVFDA